MKRFAKIMAHVLFWSWNAIFLSFVTLGFLPIIGMQLVDAVRSGLIPWEFLAFGLTIVGVPVFAVLVGALFLRNSPGKLFALGYGVEAPLMVAMAGRFFAVRELMPGAALLLALATIGILTLLWQLVDTRIDTRGNLLTVIRVTGLTILLLVGLYASLWIAFYVPPAIVGVVEMVIDVISELPRSILNGNGPPPITLPFAVMGFVLMVYSATLFVVLPVAVPIIYIHQWWQGMRTLRMHYWRAPAYLLPVVVTLICAGLFVWSNQQPQRRAFALAEQQPSSLQEATRLMEQKETIRTGLLNAYLASYRYTSAQGEVHHISELYRYTLRLPPETANQIQGWYETVVRPFLYEPVQADASSAEGPARDPFSQQDNALRADANRAAELYQQVFDQPINKAELETITRAVRATWNRDMATSAWQAVDDREILLLRQEVNITEHGDWADIELYEAYQNQTPQRQEVVYYFSLPESAVITGLWLGDSDDRSTRFEYQVAPRGAAQSMYRNEVRRNVDPALVEQIGPRQYRLRVFPIEPPRWRWVENAQRTQLEAAPQMHLWLTWRTMLAAQAWPLPQLTDKRNVYWDRSSTRRINGQTVPADAAAWLPEAAPATESPGPFTHRVDFDDGTSIIAEPMGLASADTQALSDMRMAVVVDRSGSMAIYADAVEAALNRLRHLNTTTPIDVYLTAPQYRGEQPEIVSLADLKAAQLTYYGGQNPADLLRQFSELQQERQYDAILVLTDNSGYEMGPGSATIAPPNAPLWMVHLGGAIPMGYDDNTLEAIQASGGGVAIGLDEALTRIVTSQQQGNIDSVDGYVWRALPTSNVAAIADSAVQTHTLSDPFAALAARRLILAETQRQRSELGEVDTLDQLHQVAIQQSIVTPYSSMIVLVNEQQRQRLAELEKRGDRFEREHEEIGETTPEDNPLVTAVPEPEEWLLIALATGMLGWLIWRRRHAASAIRA